MVVEEQEEASMIWHDLRDAPRKKKIKNHVFSKKYLRRSKKYLGKLEKIFSIGPLVLWSPGPLVPWSSGPLVLSSSLFSFLFVCVPAHVYTEYNVYNTLYIYRYIYIYIYMQYGV